MQFCKISILIKHKPPYFIGSQLRGALGYALKNTTCINPSFKCDNCFATSNCLYFQSYEEKNIFHKYRFDFELGKEYYDFSIYLFDDYVDKLPYFISAINTMLQKNGLGKDRIKFNNFEIFVNDKNVLFDGAIKLPQNYTKRLHIDNISQNIIVKFVTPIRIKKQNRFVRDSSLELEDIINSIYQRQMRLLGKEYKKFPYEIKADIIKKDLSFKELIRISNRQKTKMRLGGLVGQVHISNINRESFEVLKVGELIGVGKSTVFGLGKIKVEEIIC
jgi:CRISPR-associated endoribonuclease Cas6